MNISIKNAENQYVKIVHNMMRTKLFMPVGLELNSTSVFFETSKEFALKEFTFGYYNPIDNSIHVNIEHPFFTSCKNEIDYVSRITFVLFHEAMHKILMHTPQRLKDKNPKLWNIASDYEVHNMYYIFADSCLNAGNGDNVPMQEYIKHINPFLIDRPSSMKDTEENPEFLFSKDFLDKIAEEIYCLIENSKEESHESMTIPLSNFMNNNSDSDTGNSDSDDNSSKTNQKKNGKNNSGEKTDVTVTTTTYKLPSGKNYTVVDVKWPDQKDLPDELKKSEKQINQENQNHALNKFLIENNFMEAAKNKGMMSAGCQKFLKKLFHIKIDWVKILRNSLQTALEKTDYFAWHKVRTSSFLMPGMPYLPDIVEDEKYGTLVISRDESGSMTDEDIAKAASIILDAKAFYKKIVVIKHDTEIKKIYEFEEINEEVINCLKNRESCGGTSHKAVFEYLHNYQKEHFGEMISCYIGISDLCSDIQEYQNLIPSTVPVIWLTPMDYNDYSKGIEGKIIPIEL